MARRPLLLAVDGRSGAGKTSLALETAALLGPHLSVEVFHLDAIYPGWDGLPAALRAYAHHIVPALAAGRTARWTWWDWALDRPGEPGSTAPADIVILEGVGAGHRGVRSALGALVWVQVPDARRKDRALARDGQTFAPHWDRWAAHERAYLTGHEPAAAAGITVDGAAGASGTAASLVQALRTLQGWHAALARVPAPPPTPLRRRTIPAAPDPQALFEAAGGPVAGTAMLLESSDHATTPTPERSRYSILGLAGPDDAVTEHRMSATGEGITTVRCGAVTVRHPGPFFRWLAGVWPQPPVGSQVGHRTGGQSAPEKAIGPFGSGWMGWLGYGLKRETGSPDGPATRRGAGDGGEDGDGPAEAMLFRPGRLATVDHAAGTTTLSWAAEDDGGAAWADRVADAACGLAAGGPATGVTAGGLTSRAPVFTLRDSRDEYLELVRRAQREIYEGNTYEVCLTTMLEATTAITATTSAQVQAPVDGWVTYRRLVAANRAPFTLYVRTAGVEVLSTSPERFLSLSAAGRLVTEPIKGTRPRGATPEQDGALALELATSVKDRAENIMITDLARNDLSRVSVPGTLATERLCAIESYPTVHQMVSTVTARLDPGVPRADALAAAFPPGSMTGAPKISTMDILERLETGPRGIYSGVAGYLADDGAADLSVLIRTLVAIRDAGGTAIGTKAGTVAGAAVPAGAASLARSAGPGRTRLSFGVGGAITADSVPEQEWDEVRIKAHGVLRVLGSDFPGEAQDCHP